MVVASGAKFHRRKMLPLEKPEKRKALGTARKYALCRGVRGKASPPQVESMITYPVQKTYSMAVTQISPRKERK